MLTYIICLDIITTHSRFIYFVSLWPSFTFINAMLGLRLRSSSEVRSVKPMLGIQAAVFASNLIGGYGAY
ncbi:hypothetical protein BD414DRAFT_472136 [Trametes punicea]|nr:hypothetical protein BD414DRAFT_472136 [Trametes punicea]